jgi:hypothetical protein
MIDLGKLFILNYLGEKCMKIITKRQDFSFKLQINKVFEITT